MGIVNHKIDFKIGEQYIIDKNQDGGVVTLVHFFPDTMVFGKVKNEETGYEWETMLSRLSEIKEQNK